MAAVPPIPLCDYRNKQGVRCTALAAYKSWKAAPTFFCVDHLCPQCPPDQGYACKMGNGAHQCSRCARTGLDKAATAARRAELRALAPPVTAGATALLDIVLRYWDVSTAADNARMAVLWFLLENESSACVEAMAALAEERHLPQLVEATLGILDDRAA